MVQSEARPAVAFETKGSGPDLVLFHGGFGCRKHWARNVDALAEHFKVHALDHPSYGESAPVSREMTGPEYLDFFYARLLEMFPGDAPLKFAGFSFGGAISTNMATRFAERVTHLCLISPAGAKRRSYKNRPTRSYKEAGDDETIFREICRHNLLINMLSYPETITDATLDIQAYCVRNTKFNSRKVSGGETLLDDLAKLKCNIRLLWGEGDDSEYRPADQLIGDIAQAVVGELDVYRVPKAGHWSAYENADAVNASMTEFFKTA
ncbi:MAG: alpha/beta fold hydrolase [Proteobacteria bacterium]|nr:alpha/beta fold hydrolase [Pseudomonadota bacterium]